MCWPETPVEPESDRRHGEDGCFFPRIREIHWLSIISSTVLVFLLVGFVADILMRVLPNDLAGYNLTEESTSGGSGMTLTKVIMAGTLPIQMSSTSSMLKSAVC